MKKKFFVIATLSVLLTSCESHNHRGYGYATVYRPPITTYGSYNTGVGTVSGAQKYIPGSISYQLLTPSYYSYPYTTTTISPYVYNYGYPNYGYGYGYGYPNYSYYPYNYFYRPYRWGNFFRHCELSGSKLNFSLETPDGFERRNISDNLRAQTFGKRTEVQYENKEIQYENENEKLYFFTNDTGKTFVSGKVLVDDQLVSLDPKTQKCTSTRTQLEDDPDNLVAKFDCTSGDIKITAEVLIPSDQQNSALVQVSQKK